MEICGVSLFSLAFIIILLNLQRVYCNVLSYEGGLSPAEQQEKDRVVNLPGISFNLDFDHYAGFVTVDPGPGRALFYWFFEAVEDPSSKPLVLFLNGGPGCSGAGVGLMGAVGPFYISTDGKTLYPSPYSYNQLVNMLFVDSPVGTGYSYSTDPKDRFNNGDQRTVKEALVFLEKWLERFPQYMGRELYMIGESYAGHYIAQLAQEIMQLQTPKGNSSINLKGYMVGSALTDDFHSRLGQFQFMWSEGLISDETYRLLNIFCVPQSFVHISPECQKIIDKATEEYGDIDRFNIFAPSCTSSGSKRQQLTGGDDEHVAHCSSGIPSYFNSSEVQSALHVDPQFAPSNWVHCSDLVHDYYKDSATSMLDVYQELIHSGLRIWLYSGNVDTAMPVAATRYSIRALNLTTFSTWHAWYHNGQVGGWTQDYDGLTYVVVRGAGHQVAMDKPELVLLMFKTFLSGGTMSTFSEHADS